MLNDVLLAVFHFFPQIFFLGTMSWRQRSRVYIEDLWNKCDLIAIGLFITGVICRYTQILCSKGWITAGLSQDLSHF